MLNDYGVEKGTMSIHCNNSSAINISKNLVLHSQTKHIKTRHHFIRDLVEDTVISFEFVPIERQLVGIFTKPMDSL